MGGGRLTTLFLILFLSSSFEPFRTSAAGQVTQKTPSSGIANWHKTWCVAKPSSNETTLLANVNYACSQVDCGVLRKGCPCFYPDNLMSHASIAMNLYYQAKGRNKWNCDFRNSGLIVISDPSYSDCAYTA